MTTSTEHSVRDIKNKMLMRLSEMQRELNEQKRELNTAKRELEQYRDDENSFDRGKRTRYSLRKQ